MPISLSPLESWEYIFRFLFYFSKLGKGILGFSFSSRNWRNEFQISLSLLDSTFWPLVNDCCTALTTHPSPTQTHQTHPSYLRELPYGKGAQKKNSKKSGLLSPPPIFFLQKKIKFWHVFCPFSSYFDPFVDPKIAVCFFNDSPQCSVHSSLKWMAGIGYLWVAWRTEHLLVLIIKIYRTPLMLHNLCPKRKQIISWCADPSLGGWWLTGPPIITNPKAPKKCDEPREADEWASSPPLVGWEAVSPPAEHSSSILHLSRAPLHSFLFIPSPSSYFQQHK